jgi:hypothetical protein
LEVAQFNRYVGTKNTTLVTHADGSLTIHASAAPPDDSLKPNWLPAPRGDFSLCAYWPQQAILDGHWNHPPSLALPLAGRGLSSWKTASTLFPSGSTTNAA